MATATEIHKEGFERTLDRIRADADSAFDSGRRFERLMKQYFRVDPVYTDQFSDVWLWSEWVAEQPNFTARDLGIDLVAAVRDGGYCAIQCKFHAADTRITKAAHARLAELDIRRLRGDLASLKAKGLVATTGHGRGARWKRL